LSIALAAPRLAGASAASFGLFQHGARAIGQAGAFAARASDPSAIFYNPAAIAKLQNFQLEAGVDFANPTHRFQSPPAALPAPPPPRGGPAPPLRGPPPHPSPRLTSPPLGGRATAPWRSASAPTPPSGTTRTGPPPSPPAAISPAASSSRWARRTRSLPGTSRA